MIFSQSMKLGPKNSAITVEYKIKTLNIQAKPFSASCL
jgi:hypothetical protein